MATYFILSMEYLLCIEYVNGKTSTYHFKQRKRQCDQIWKNLITLVKFHKSLALQQAYFYKYLMSLGKYHYCT